MLLLRHATIRWRTSAQAADVGQDDALWVAVRNAAAPFVAAKGWVEALVVDRPLPDVHALRPAPIASQDALQAQITVLMH